VEQSRKPQLNILYDCEILATLRHTHLGSFFCDTEDVRSLSLGQSGTLSKEQGSHGLDISLSGTKDLLTKAYVQRDRKGSNPFVILFWSVLFYSGLFYSILF